MVDDLVGQPALVQQHDAFARPSNWFNASQLLSQSPGHGENLPILSRAQLFILADSPARQTLMSRRETPQPVRSQQERERSAEIVAHVQQITRQHRPRHRTRVSEDNSDDHQRANLHPAAPQLRRMEKSEKNSRRQHAPRHAKSSRHNRKNVAAKNSLLD